MTNRQIGSLAFTGALAAVWMWAVPVGAQNLNEVAKREKERRERVQKNSPSPAPSFTEEDLKDKRESGRPPAEAGAGEEATGAAGESSAPAAEEEKSSVESYWESRLSAARDDVERAKARVTELEAAARAARGAPTAGTYTEAQQEADRRRQVIEDYAAAQRELAQAERALGDLEREARRGGASLKQPQPQQ
jgi:hypothetical protein